MGVELIFALGLGDLMAGIMLCVVTQATAVLLFAHNFLSAKSYECSSNFTEIMDGLVTFCNEKEDLKVI